MYNYYYDIHQLANYQKKKKTGGEQTNIKRSNETRNVQMSKIFERNRNEKKTILDNAKFKVSLFQFGCDMNA